MNEKQQVNNTSSYYYEKDKKIFINLLQESPHRRAQTFPYVSK
jgi:hypothetical protein